MNIVEQPAESARKYCVLRRLGSWRVELEGRSLGVFQEATEAVDVACRLARHDARGGRVATVTAAEASPQEFHCFAPPPGQPAAAPRSGPPPHLRLVTP